VWYVLNVAPHCEPQVAKFLSHEGVESYVPQFPIRPRAKPGSVRDRRSRVVFPGYLFFRVPLGFGHWDAIRWAPGVRRVLQLDGGPAFVPEEVVARIRRRLAEGLLQPAPPRFKKGDAVTIEHGPLAAVDAIFDCELGDQQRVQVLVNMMHRLIPVRIDLESLRPAGVWAPGPAVRA
jgi:transcription antitermination factor NusG